MTTRKRNVIWIIAGLAAGALLLTACKPAPAEAMVSTPPPAEDTVPGVDARGIVVPEQWTLLSFSLGGTLARLEVSTGDVVRQGDVIARLDTAQMEIGVAQAEAGLAAAEANLALVLAGASPEEIQAAEQAVRAADARVAAAVAQRDALYSAITEADIAEAEARVNEARYQLDKARDQLNYIANFDPALCAQAEQQQVNLNPELLVGLPPDVAQAVQEQLQASLRFQCPIGMYGMVEDYTQLAELGLQASEAYLAMLRDGPNQSQVDIENARIRMASAAADAARARLELLKAQPFPEQVVMAQAQVAQAEAEVAIARALLQQGELIAPFPGTITDVLIDAGEFIAPGQPVVRLADLSRLRVETTDLNEIEVARVQEGSRTVVTFDALPGVEVEGTVVSIAPRAAEGIGVTYTAIVALEAPPADLRWGMTAFVAIEGS